MIKKIVLVLTILLFGYVGLLFLASWTSERMPSAFKATPNPAYAVMCFLSGERVSGLYKICYYNCLGSTVAITVKAHQLCPLTINR